MTSEMKSKKAEKGSDEKSKKSSKKKSSKEQLAELEAQIEESKDKYLRLFAEFENYRKRTTKEKLELMSTAAESTLKTILPILDDFDRAKLSADDENSPEQFSDGVKLVYDKLYAQLGIKGLKQMESTGEDFDPELHEAITEIPAPDKKMVGKIIDTVEKGYYLNEKIIRHAKVVVGK